jgi:isopropylmalate/homocitrate/citramalate synthase
VVWNEGESWAAVTENGVDRVKVMCEVSTYAPTDIFQKARQKAMDLAEKIAAMLRKAA